MKRTMILGVALVFGWLGLATVSEAQVFIRAPFVRVSVGNGVAVRAPFVNIYVPGDGPYYYPPDYGPRGYLMPPPIVVPPQNQPFQVPQPQPLPAVKPQVPEVKPPIKEESPPQPMRPVQTPTLESFAKTFKPKAGTYEVEILNPVSKQPTTVRFMLPDGTPKRVHTTRDSIEFVYGLRQWVRIEFDRDGATVTAR